MFLYPSEPMSSNVDEDYQEEYEYNKNIDPDSVAIIDIELKKFQK